MKNTLVTSYRNVKSNKGQDVDMLDWLKDDSHKEDIVNLRKLDDIDEYKRIKSTLPCATLSGTFSIRKVDGLQKHSGYMCIDIDGKENPNVTDYGKLRDGLKNISNVSYASLSVGGQGVFCLIPISNPEKHKEHFFALEKCFKELGIIIDKSCKDVSRMRIMSYDPEAYINEDAKVFTEVFHDKIEIKKRPEKAKVAKIRTADNSEKNKHEKDRTKKKVIEIIQKIKTSKKDITKVYEKWFKLACALNAEFGESGRDLYHQLSKNNPKYNPLNCDAQFDAVVKRKYNRTQIGTFFHIAKEHGLID